MGYFLCACVECGLIDSSANFIDGKHDKCDPKCKYTYEEAKEAMEKHITKRYISAKTGQLPMFFEIFERKTIDEIMQKYNINLRKREKLNLVFHNHFYKCVDCIVLHRNKPHFKKFKEAIRFVNDFMY